MLADRNRLRESDLAQISVYRTDKCVFKLKGKGVSRLIW